MIKLLKNLNELVMFKHSIFSLPFIFITMIIEADGFFGWRMFTLGALAAISARNFAMGFNRLVDIDIDIQNPRTSSRPSVDGRISKKNQIIFISLNALIYIIVAYLCNMSAFWLCVPVLIVLASYSYFKRFSSYAHLVLGISLALAPLAGVIAISGSTHLWTWLLSFGVLFWVAGFDLLYSLQDIKFDQKMKLYSIPAIYGEKATLFISQIFHILTIVFWVLFAFASSAGGFIFFAIIFSSIMLYIEHKIVNKDFTKIDIAFFTINGYLGIMFLIFTILDKL